ncbi:uridine kinase family protein [Dyadobacter frigoris]|uniref:Uridine kinase n=1 Tax=Dyadobacter frigoris TaxID=2576211 RepID=A0A4U6DAK1_9BACT|nr:uridine kinase [Dyadobacter frigoris]TKT93431.1 uridine kinase [Dyadobacter frigoris]GLU55846.1 uridine kinase [Dyadobacter frigoris]
MTPHEKPPFIIGITGGSASGKTFFMKCLIDSFKPEDVCRISQDNYYRPIHEIPRDENGVENFDLPETIDHHLFAEHIAVLRAGREVHQKEYTFNNPLIKPEILVFEPRPIIIVEGIFVLYFPDIARLIDLKIFVDAKEHVKIKRRIIRDNNERGYDLDDVLYRWEHHVAPTYDKYILPLRSEADMIINNNTRFDTGLDVLVGFLRKKLEERE